MVTHPSSDQMRTDVFNVFWLMKLRFDSSVPSQVIFTNFELTSMFSISDLAFQMASYGFPEIGMYVIQNKQIGNPK